MAWDADTARRPRDGSRGTRALGPKSDDVTGGVGPREGSLRSCRAGTPLLVHETRLQHPSLAPWGALTPMSEPSRSRILRLRVPVVRAGDRLDLTILDLFDGLARKDVQDWIRAGAVTLDGREQRKPSSRVAGGEELEVQPQEPVEVPRSAEGDQQFRLVEERETWAVVEKPAGMLTHGTTRVRGGTVADRARERWGDLPSLQGEDRPGIVHRLDAGTSGLLVLAKTQVAMEHLLEQFRKRRVRKVYTTIVHHEPRFDSGWIREPLERDPRHHDRIRVVPDDEEIGPESADGDGTAARVGREAATLYEVRERFRNFAHLECKPKTGRTHQIRVHLTHLGHPLLGDNLYRHRGAMRDPWPEDAPELRRHALHAGELGFTDPEGGGTVRFEAPLAEDLAAALAWLRVNRPDADVV